MSSFRRHSVRRAAKEVDRRSKTWHKPSGIQDDYFKGVELPYIYSHDREVDYKTTLYEPDNNIP